jgi:outer membrane protein assembly factor BamB
VYFGSGDGRLYALHARDGTRRWSFDTTSIDRSSPSATT